jgi:hypothetical protein
MTLSDVRAVLFQAARMGSVEWIYFEGGEPFLYYPVMLMGMLEAKRAGFKVGLVTNGYWATTPADAIEWLTPMVTMGIDDLSISDDSLHSGEGEVTAKNAIEAGRALGLPVKVISLCDVAEGSPALGGRAVTGGAVMFRGRAAEKMTKGKATRPWASFDRCVDEDFVRQSRVHLDPFGYVHVCQGIVIGNFKVASLSEILGRFDPREDPITGPLVRGGTAGLAREFGIDPPKGTSMNATCASRCARS